MRRMSIVLAVALAAGGMGASAAAAQAAPAAPAAVLVPGEQPPWPYADCLDAAKQHKETPEYAKWHCDELVKKGWIKPPNPGAQSKAKPKKKPAPQPKASKPAKAAKPAKPAKPAKAAKPAKPAKGKAQPAPQAKKKAGDRAGAKGR